MLKDSNDFEKFFIWYFLGLLISRLGSLVFEKAFRKFAIIKFADYKDYVEVSKNDKLISQLSEQNNTYRTMLALFSVVFIVSLIKFICLIDLNMKVTYIVELIFSREKLLLFSLIMMLVFFYSYKNQTKFIYDRVNIDLQKNNT